LIIERSVDGSAARTIRRQSLNQRLLLRLRKEGVRFRDGGLTTPTETARRAAYRASLAAEDSDETPTVARSPVLKLRWPPAPPLPGQPLLQAVSDTSVRLSWPSRGFATRVLRRNVLEEADTPKTVATVPPGEGETGRYRDEDIEQGDVLAYQIAYGTPIEVSGGGSDMSRSMRWGPVSEALYVSVK
jgi:hypothetical protein